MTYVLRLLFYAFREIFFNNKEEADPTSKTFDIKKYIMVIMLTGSITFNYYILTRLITVTNSYRIYRLTVVKYCEAKLVPETLCGKKMPEPPSNVANARKNAKP